MRTGRLGAAQAGDFLVHGSVLCRKRIGYRIVIPAKAGIHLDFSREPRKSKWIPACAGMTSV
ncbi:hypothetical protein FQY83_09610 [Luteimonas marina]|uniref:Uncharacterized protein n=1 Tax=Luteimonas marina TaxID=488485 RepID=A0A5C5U2G3_9GAMM|nr:hypothetical protein FQY83_09610 [Luteimonas marina]